MITSIIFQQQDVTHGDQSLVMRPNSRALIRASMRPLASSLR
jgi:hypothetical protein